MMKPIANPCVFCLDELQRPCCLACGHTFCTGCLLNYLQVRNDPRCPLCRRVFQVSAGDLCEASNVSHTDTDTDTDLDSCVVSAMMPGTTVATVQPSASQSPTSGNDMRTTDYVHFFDIDMLNDTLVLTLTEQEVRLFTDLYEEVLRENRRQTSAQDASDTWSFRNMIGT